MANLLRTKFFDIGKVLINEVETKTFKKQVATVNNQFINLKIVNAMVEDSIYLNIVDNNIKQSYIQKLHTKNKHLQIRLVLQGKLEKLDHSTNEKKIYNKNEISLEYKENIEESLLNKQGQHIRYICVTLNEIYLNDNTFFCDMFKQNFSKKFYEPDLASKFDELFQRDYSSEIDKFYLKNKTMEIIFYVLEELEKNHIINGFDEEDIKRIKKARNILDNFFYEKMTIELLSKKVAINQTKLKKGFKQIYNKTIHEYLKDIRLSNAIKYLKTNRYSIKEVALMVGYTNQGSFSYAFSNKYKCSPKDVQKNSNL
jgi:AraC-like DNA-binding protein